MNVRIVAAACAVGALLGLGAVPVYAEPNTNENLTTVGPKTNGPTVSQGTAGFDPNGTQASATSSTNPPATGQANDGRLPDPGSNLLVRPIPFNQVPSGALVSSNGTILPNLIGTQQACPAGQTGFFVSDPNGNGVQTVCVPNQGPAPAQAIPASPLQLALEASARQPWPNLQVNVNPTLGMAGLATWFWCAGSASMPDATATAGPLTVTVRAVFSDVTWSFGDGSAASGGMGRPFPNPSDIQHVYQTDSAGLARGYPVVASVRWRVTFSVNGGPFNDLGFKTRDFTRPYEVEQLQPEAVRVP